MSWNNGYVSDIEYPTTFFREQSPNYLNFVCMLNGYEPVALDKPFTYCELGCGAGFVSNVLAASNPNGQFHAVDFLPAHVADARELASQAGLENLTVLENSFAELASGAVDLPQFDFVTMYGVYTWVNAENRRHIGEFLKRYVKPGGVVFVNYNVMPGWAMTSPLQKLILEAVGTFNGTRAQQCAYARQLVGRLNVLEAKYFTENASPQMKLRLKMLEEESDGYIAHEYMNHDWLPLYHEDVREQFARARLEYVGSGNVIDAFGDFNLTAQQKDLLDRWPKAMRETFNDYLQDISFRNDIYVHGPRPLSSERKAELMQRTGLALPILRSRVKYKIKLCNDITIDRDDLFRPVLDALEEAPRTLSELMALPAMKNETAETVWELAALLINTSQAASYDVRDNGACGSTQRMNRAVAFSSSGKLPYVLASPVLGSGVALGRYALKIYRVLCELGADADVDAVSSRVLELIKTEAASGEGKSLSAPDDKAMEDLPHRIRNNLRGIKLVWRQLGVL